MGPGYFVLALLGCDDSGFICREARIVNARFGSGAACMAAISGQLSANSDLAYPVILGRCQPAAPRMAARKKDRAG